jgi:hypothetical protein
MLGKRRQPECMGPSEKGFELSDSLEQTYVT